MVRRSSKFIAIQDEVLFSVQLSVSPVHIHNRPVSPQCKASTGQYAFDDFEVGDASIFRIGGGTFDIQLYRVLSSIGSNTSIKSAIG